MPLVTAVSRLAHSIQPHASRAAIESPKYEKAAMRWLERYLAESSPRLQHFAEVTASLAKRELQAGGLNQTLLVPRPLGDLAGAGDTNGAGVGELRVVARA
jgi:hypothetical protein